MTSLRRLPIAVLGASLAFAPVSRADDAGVDDQILLKPREGKIPAETVEGWKRECATKGTPKACYNVAVDYAQARGDEAKAVEYLRPLCKKDYVLGCFNLGGIMVKEVATRKEGLAAFRKACTLSEAKAGTPKENEVTESACSISEVVAKNMDADYTDIAYLLGIGAKPSPPTSTAPRPSAASSSPEPSSAPGPTAHDLTGRYKAVGGSVSLLQGTGELWVFYESVFSGDHDCSCLAQASPQDSGSWQMSGDLVGKLDVTPSEIVISAEEKECCGANWGGVGRVRNHAKPLQRCAVTAPKLAFHAADKSLTKAYLVAGDKVDAVVDQGRIDTDFVIARFAGKKKTTIGLLEKAGVTCAGKAGHPE
jgi:hypothetical protein